MSENKVINVVFDTREQEEGKAWYSLINQVNAVLASGGQYRDISITQWEMYREGAVFKSDKGVNIPFYRHFYHNAGNNTLGGGFLLFEVIEDLERFYNPLATPEEDLDDVHMSFTVTVTLV